MARADGTDPALADTPVPVDGDGHELIGRIIDGRYRLDATLGRGGMGLVYRAAHVGLRRQVAVKILHPSLAASPDVRNRFEREALAVGKIDHPNCVSVYDVGRLPDGSLYLAMELLEGRPLSEVLEHEGQIAPGRALHILAGILRGLSHIHAAGLIHRDIKPENIFLIRHGQDEDFAKILDFGIAKAMKASDLDDGVKLTQAGMAFGTPIYMAPEQALGNPMDGRADIYAASVMAYEMLAGQPPFYSDDKLEVMSMHTARPVPPMRTRMIKNGRAVPSSIERLVVRGLTKKPSERWPNADVYLAEVEEALRTPDGGVTDVNFERPSDTGAQPLITDDGELSLDLRELRTGSAADATLAIADAISESLAEAADGRVATRTGEARVPSVPAAGAVAQPGAKSANALATAGPKSVGPTMGPRSVEPTLGPKSAGVVGPKSAGGRAPDIAPAGRTFSSNAPPVPGVAARPPVPTPVPRAAVPGSAVATTAPAKPLGGVGLGLPYTGPKGEPIFGLTPEARLASAVEPKQSSIATAAATPTTKGVPSNASSAGGASATALSSGGSAGPGGSMGVSSALDRRAPAGGLASADIAPGGGASSIGGASGIGGGASAGVAGGGAVGGGGAIGAAGNMGAASSGGMSATGDASTRGPLDAGASRSGAVIGSAGIESAGRSAATDASGASGRLERESRSPLAASGSKTGRGAVSNGLDVMSGGVDAMSSGVDARDRASRRRDGESSTADTYPAAGAAKVRKRFGLHAVIAGCAVALGVVVALAWPGGGSKGGLDPASPAGAANDAYERGNPARAIQILEANKAAIASDPDAQLVLGHAHAARHESAAALAAYELALKLSPELERETALRANLRAMAADRDPGVIARAFELWVGGTNDPEARALVEKAAISEELPRRHAVAPVIEQHKLGDDVDWLRAYTFDLAQENTCPARKEAVAKLRALGDARAVEPLELAIQRKGVVGATRGKYINGCLVDDAKAAIGYLRGLPKRPEP